MRIAVTFLLTATLLAGCGAKGGSDDDKDIFGPPPEVEDGKGLIRGIVVSPSLVPVQGATVRIGGTDLSQVTDVNGAFVFVDLAPGLYFVRAEKPGWTETQQSTSVAADVDEPEILRVMIERIPGSEPRAFTQRLEGFISCSWGTPTDYGDCNTIDEQKARVFAEIPDRPTWIQTELLWEGSQPTGDWFYVIQAVCPCGNQTPPVGPLRFNETYAATSPYVVRVGPGFLDEQDAGGVNQQVVVDVSASGPEPETTNGSGVAINQDFEVFITLFYNFEPDPDWTFHLDGEYPVPPV